MKCLFVLMCLAVATVFGDVTVFNAGRELRFIYTKVNGNQAAANCRSLGNTFQLANMNSVNLLNGLRGAMPQLRVTTELWVNGNSDKPHHSKFADEELPATVGARCRIISNWPNQAEAWNGYVKDCNGDRFYVCENLGVNIAQGKTATMSNQNNMQHHGPPARAVDGNTNTNWGGSSCTHTNNIEQPYWKVDLGQDYMVSKVAITNRKDCCSERLSNFVVGVSEVNDEPAVNNYHVCAVHHGALGAGETKTLECGVQGRYVSIQLLGKNYLTLCEVQVFQDNIALGRPASQPNQGWNGNPNRALDGNANANYFANSCTHTQLMKDPWWRVDLGAEYHVTAVAITNRKDCCAQRLHDVNVYATAGASISAAQPCACCQEAFGAGERRSLPCGLSGRFVTIELKANSEYLTMCEVEVFTGV